jgi:DNA-binding GntR family transcriptional regulator
MFGMTHSQISNIQMGKSWQHVGGSIRKSKAKRVADEIRDKIRVDWATGNYTQQQLAEMYNVSRQTIGNIINEK